QLAERRLRDEFDSTKHIISAFDVPKHWPRFRAVDHGLVHPAACVWAAISPAGDLFIYGEYLRTGRVPTQICADIVEKSGNTLVKIGDYANPKTSMVYSRFQEQQTGTKFQWTVFDGKAFNSPTGDSGLPLSKIYDLAGLRMKKGSGQVCDYYVPILKEWFVINNEKKHFETGEPGAPRIYIFDTCPEFIKGIKRWIWTRRRNNSEESKKMSPTKKDDDLMDCMKILIQANPCYIGSATMADVELYPGLDDSRDSNARLKTNAVVDSITGY
ncbi:MAG: hypothetical protein KAG97_11150, partial [Victivallales bacterium]|nr:hypothetical protein [Victivallales bacterium]